jgi:serine/threonine protein kinase
MSNAPYCADAKTLSRFLLGHCPPEEVERLAGHVESCDRCIAVLSTLQDRDALLDAMQARPTGQCEPPTELVERVYALRTPASTTDTAGVGGLLAQVGGAAAETTQELYDFLAPPRQPGEIGWLGPYRVLEVLGVGGMGIVFQAEDPQLKRPLALKTVRSLLSAQAEARQRFLHEARAAAAIEHDHVVSIYHVGEDRGVPFLAMPLLQGETLDDRLKREGRLPQPEVVRIGREVAAGLAAAHQRGLIHRDVKPSNIWLQGEPGALATGGKVKLLDFGLARAASSEPAEAPAVATAEVHSRPAWTQVGTVVGTPAYIAPEQARGEPLDPRADLFSLGCVLYRLCTGVTPFGRATVHDTLRAVQQEQPRPIRELQPAVSGKLEAVIGKLLAKRPEDRYPSAQAVAAALDGLAGAAPRHRRRWIAVVAAVLLAVGLAVYWLGPVLRPGAVESPQPSPASSPLAPPCHFALPTDYPVGRQPHTVAVGDFNRDGHLDLVVSNMKSNTISVLLGRGDGTFRPAVEQATGRGPHGLVVADFNGDGRVDLAVCNTKDHTISILLGKGDGTFRPARSLATDKGPLGLAVGDVNGDGKMDLVATNSGANTMGVFLGAGDGTFRSAGRYPVVGYPVAVCVADVNNDRRADLVVASSGGDFVAVFLGNGDGTFQAAGTFGVGSGPGFVVVEDFNGDGKPDIAVENFGSHDVSVLLGKGDGTFGAPVSYGVGTGPGGLAAADFNGDGLIDLVVANHGSQNMSVLLGKGDGTFRPAEHYALGHTPAGVAVADFNGDGRLDVAVVNHHSHTVSVLLNQLPTRHFRINTNREMLAGNSHTVSVTALDAWNNSDPTYTGTVVMTSSDPRMTFGSNWKFDGKFGPTQSTQGCFRTAGVQTLTVVDPANPLHHGRISVLVTPGAATRLRLEAPSPVLAGKPCDVIVTAVDQFDNDTDYTGTVHLTSNAPGAMVPADYTFAAADEGRHVFRLLFPQVGEWALTASDTARRPLTGSLKVIVRPGNAGRGS